MNHKFKKPLKVAFGIFAIVVCAVVAYSVFEVSSRKLSLMAVIGEDNRILADIYNGVPTRFGLIIRGQEQVGKRVVVYYQLMQVVARKANADGSEQLLVVAYRNIRPEVSKLVENEKLDPLAIDSLESIIDPAEQWWGSALWCIKQNSHWQQKAKLDQVIGGGSVVPYKVEFPQLSSSAPSLMVRVPMTFPVEHFYSLVDNEFREILRVTTDINDLDECMKYRASHEARAAEAKETPSRPADESDGEEGEVDDEPDYTCANAHAARKILTTQTNGFNDVEVTVEGEGPKLERHSKRYLLHYSPQLKLYVFADHKGRDESMDQFWWLWLDPIHDFIGDL